jgi:2-(1,2-epoxy-1,2-dihydrophenyl)acetyl-CoA isomerase
MAILMDTDYETIRLEADGEDLLWLVLDRPRVLNALSAAVLGELLDALPRIARSGARALIVRGEGRSFCSGADLMSLPDDVDLGDTDDIRRHMRRWRDVILGIRKLPVPSVAAVTGHAYGGGLNLALACDLVVVSESARLCQSYVDRGVPTDLGGSYVFPRLVGWGRARKLLLTGEVIDGIEAERIGLAASVATEDDLYAKARELAALLAAKDPTVIVEMRRLLDEGVEGSLDEALDREGEAVTSLLAAPGIREKLQSYRT